jgi:uncharacterized membrane protein
MKIEIKESKKEGMNEIRKAALLCLAVPFLIMGFIGIITYLFPINI